MKIKKVLNQNAVLIDDDGQEKVAIGKGVGFSKKQNDLIHGKDIERIFIMERDSQKKLQLLLNKIDEKYFFAAEKIIDYAETNLMETLSENLIIALTDHISFSAENIKNGIFVTNKLLKEIEVLYQEEFHIAQWAVDFLCHELSIPYSYNEAGFIAIHIHSARQGNHDNQRSVREVTIISDIVSIIEKDIGRDLHSEEMLLDYVRLTTHLRLMLQRFYNRQYATLDTQIFDVVKEKYADSYNISKKIKVFLIKQYKISITKEELGYITLHIERLKRENKESKENE